jgi:hypothetical protein
MNFSNIAQSMLRADLEHNLCPRLVSKYTRYAGPGYRCEPMQHGAIPDNNNNKIATRTIIAAQHWSIESDMSVCLSWTPTSHQWCKTLGSSIVTISNA